MRGKLSITVAVVAAVVPLAVPGLLQAQRYTFKFYGEDEGLQNLVIQVVLQDRAGFLWAGTQNGLFRYDGSRFTGFSRADGLPVGRIEALHESVDGTLWVGTRAGLAQRAAERFETVPLGAARGVTARQAIASSRDGHLYVATDRGLAVGTKTAQGWSFSMAPPAPGHPASEEATSVFVDSKGAVWYGCGPSGLCRLDAGKPTDAAAAEGLPADRWEAIREDLEAACGSAASIGWRCARPTPGGSNCAAAWRRPPTRFRPWRWIRRVESWCRRCGAWRGRCGREMAAPVGRSLAQSKA
jgi:hypothetical protein